MSKKLTFLCKCKMLVSKPVKIVSRPNQLKCVLGDFQVDTSMAGRLVYSK